MNLPKPATFTQNSHRTPFINFLFLLALDLSLGPWVSTADAQNISDSAVRQIIALEQEKDARTPPQKKLDSQLIYARSKVSIGVASAAAPDMKPDVTIQTDGRVLVDITAAVSNKLLSFITDAGGQVVNSFARYDAIRALVPLAKIEELAGRADVRFVSRAHEGTTNTGSVDGQGDTCHSAIQARSTFGVDGTGVKVGALSDSVDYLANSQALGDLGPVNVISGQAGSGAGEGTAMLEIIHDLAPGATLYFATANNSAASFAANIDALVASGCNIIVDDYTYLYESPFQDGQPIVQAVKRASDAGVLYFSSARNSGNKDSGTSGTWEGDFADGGAAGSPLPAGRLHNFGGGTTYDTVTAVSSARADLFWSDRLGGSGNDYDLYVLNSTGTTVMRSSTTTQSGTQDPYEAVSTLNAGERIVILQKTGAAARFLHLDTGRSRLAINTDGNVRGHNAASAGNAFSVAAVDVHTTSPFPSPFTGGASNPVETFSSDGPRRLFFYPDGTAITPGNFSSTGGMLIQKPDITAADGASGSSAVPNFSPFYGTSAAAPHAAAIAALLKSYAQFLTPAQMRTALTNSALDIMSVGWDRTSGPGIAMALQALQSVPNASYLVLTNATASDVGGGNGNGSLDPGETIHETVVWKNLGTTAATNVAATLSTGIAGITVTSPSAAYLDIPSGALGTNLTAFAYRLAKTVPCGTVLSFTNIVSANGKYFTNTFTHIVGQLVAGVAVTNNLDSTDIPKTIPDVTTIYSTNIIAAVGVIDDVNVTVRLNHTYDGDLVLALQDPDGTEVTLTANRGSSGDNYGSGTCGAGEVRTTFDDQAATLISAGTAPFAGSYRPDGALSNLNGKTVNGTWRLRVSDTASVDTGTLYCWGMEIVSHQTNYACTLFDHAPVAGNQIVIITAGTSTNLTLQSSDADGDALTFQTNSLPAHGTLTGFNPTTGVITYTAAVGYGGPDSFTFISNDGYSNSALATVSFTVIAAPPVLTCATNKTVECGTAWIFDPPEASAGCNGSTVTVSIMDTVTNGSCPQLITRTWLGVDACGNSNTCSQVVTVRDTTPPVLTCATNKTVECDGAWSFDPPGTSDGCSGTNVTVSILSTVTNGTCPQLITRTWLGVDACGNSNTCSQVVTVHDTTPPVLTCATNKTVECDSAWNFDPPVASDACSGTNLTVMLIGVVTNGTCPEVITATWAAVDACGNTNTCSQSVTNVDLTPPVLVCATNKTVEYGSTWNFDPPAASDTCNDTNLTVTLVGVVTNGTCPEVITATWVAVDACGNTNTCSQSVTNVDLTPPLLVCVTNKTVACGSTWSFDPPVATDVGSGTNITVTLLGVVTNGTCPEVFTATWVAADACGNTNTCSQSVTNVDLTPPVLLCATNKSVECGSTWGFDPPVATDVCSGNNITVTLLGVVTNETCPEVFTATWVAADSCGNTNTCSQSVTNVDLTPPLLVCATNKTVECGNAWGFDPPAATDACSGTNVTVTLVEVVTNGTCPAVFTATWVAVDTCGNTNTCSQSVTNVLATPPVSLTLGPAEWLPAVGMRLTLLGNVTGSVAIQWTGEVTNTLSNWPTLIWFNSFSGSTQYIDSDATNFGTRFYRAVTP